MKIESLIPALLRSRGMAVLVIVVGVTLIFVQFLLMNAPDFGVLGVPFICGVVLSAIGLSLFLLPNGQQTGSEQPSNEEKRPTPDSLSSSEQFIQKITHMSPQIMYVFDIAKGRNVYANRRIADDLGYSPDEIKTMGENFLPKLLHPDDLIRLPEIVGRWKTAKDGDILELEYRMKHRSGRWHWFWARDTVFSRDANGDVKQILGIAQDITERKRTEKRAA